jgi:hypothetical protein
MPVKTLAVGQILTQEEMTKALKLYKECETHQFASRCSVEIIAPVISRINRDSGQTNDPRYLAYCIEYSLMKSYGKLQ